MLHTNEYIESDRFVVLDEPEYTFSYSVRDLGEDRYMTMIHIDVYYLSPSVMRDMIAKWRIFRTIHPNIVFAQGDKDDEKFERFVKKFGFSYLGDCPCTDGQNRRLFINYGSHLEPKKLH